MCISEECLPVIRRMSNQYLLVNCTIFILTQALTLFSSVLFPVAALSHSLLLLYLLKTHLCSKIFHWKLSIQEKSYKIKALQHLLMLNKRLTNAKMAPENCGQFRSRFAFFKFLLYLIWPCKMGSSSPQGFGCTAEIGLC